MNGQVTTASAASHNGRVSHHIDVSTSTPRPMPPASIRPPIMTTKAVMCHR